MHPSFLISATRVFSKRIKRAASAWNKPSSSSFLCVPLLPVCVSLSKYLFLSKAASTELKKVFTCRKQDYRDSQDDIIERAQGLPVLCRPLPHLKLRKSAHTDGSERGGSHEEEETNKVICRPHVKPSHPQVQCVYIFLCVRLMHTDSNVCIYVYV